jgi:hypothetical protein
LAVHRKIVNKYFGAWLFLLLPVKRKQQTREKVIRKAGFGKAAPGLGLGLLRA